MGLVSITNIVEGTTAEAADVNSRLALIVAQINGNIDSSNIKANAIGSTQIANNAVTTNKIPDGAVTRVKLADTTTTVTSGTTITPIVGNYVVTALETPATIAAPSGTPAQSNIMTLRIKDDGTARALTWNSIYRGIGVSLPTTTISGKTLYIGGKYNVEDAKWDIIGSVVEE